MSTEERPRRLDRSGLEVSRIGLGLAAPRRRAYLTVY
jgi:aryl-alcohol dehydrogenase-like predicted oxidoreductase